MDDEIRLMIPAEARMILVARMALAGYCCQHGADVDTLEDIRMLVDEACYCLLRQSSLAASMTISAATHNDKTRIRFEVKRDPDRQNGATQKQDTEIARCILDTLASNVRISQDEGEMYAIEIDVHLEPL